jgi:tight adherence protein B
MGVDMKKVSQYKKFEKIGMNTKSLIVAAISLLVFIILTNSLTIAFAFGFLIGAATKQFLKQREVKNKALLGQVWPEVIDHLISGLYSGLSISEALSDLARRGPEITKERFASFHHELLRGTEFSIALEYLRNSFSHHGSDQIFEALLLSKTLGGGELLNTLRTLSSFQREDLILSKEINIKHGWIKNSAHISAIAPWLLLLMIATQPGTSTAFSSPTGVLILGAGVLCTLMAYFWMSRLSKLPEIPRVFGTIK